MFKQITMLVGSFLLLSISGCDKISTMMNKPTIEISSLPLAQQVIISMVPLFEGKRNKSIMDQVCIYVSGRKSEYEFKAFFTTQGINVVDLAKSDEGYRFLTTADKPALTTACAAFMVSTLFTQENLLAGTDPKSSEDQIRERLQNLMPISLESIKLLAQLSAPYQGVVFGNVDAYKASLRKDFQRKAREYIGHTLNRDFRLSNFAETGGENGFSYTFSGGIVKLKLYDETWFGDGKLMGKRYFINWDPTLKNSAVDDIK